MKLTASFVAAWKRTVKNPLFLVMLAFLCFAVLFFGSIEKDVKLAPMGVVLRDEDPDALRLARNMEQDGFRRFSDEQDMCRAIRRGELSLGVAVKADLSKSLESWETEGVLVLYCMPTASSVKSSSLRITSHLGRVYAPHITEKLMQDIQVPLTDDQVRQYMDECFEKDAPFEFTVTDLEGTSLAGASQSRSLIYGMLAVLLFCLVALCTSTEKDASYRALHDRLGCKTAFFTVLLPAYGVKYAITLAVSAVAALACQWIYGTDITYLAQRCAVYLVYLFGISGLLHGLLYRLDRVQLYIMLLSLLALAGCPIFVDIGIFSGTAVDAFRVLLPPYFFYLIPQNPILCTAAAVAVCVGGLGALYFRERRITPRTRV